MMKVNPQNRVKALEYTNHKDDYVTISELSKLLNISWSTSRYILLELVIDGKVKIEKTPHGPLFIKVGGN